MRVYSWSWGVCDWRRSPAFIKNYLELFGEKQECALNSAGEADCIDELSSQLKSARDELSSTRVQLEETMNQLDSELYEWVLQRQATETKLLQDNPPPGVLMVDDGGLDQGTAPAAAAAAEADGASDAAEAEDAAATPSVPFHYGVERVRV